MYLSYLVVSKFVLRKINFGVWFVQAAQCYDRRSVRCDRQTGAWSVVAGKVSSSSLFAIWALSLSLSLSRLLSLLVR